jgi:spore germination protein
MSRGDRAGWPGRGATVTRRTVLAAGAGAVAVAAVPSLAGCRSASAACEGPSCAGREVIGYVPYWDQPRAFAVVRAQPGTFTQISPMWFSLDPGGRVVLADDVHTRLDPAAVDEIQRAGMKVLPTVTDLRNGEFTAGLVSAMVNDPGARRRHVDALVRLAAEGRYDGLDIDYEKLRAADREPYTRFLAELGAALHRDGRLLTSTVFAKESEPGEEDHNVAQDYAAIAAACDQVRVMTFDYHWSTSEPGPGAPSDWVERVMAWAVTQVPSRKLVLGLVLLGYDWPADGEGRTVTWEEATAIAREQDVAVQRGEPGRSPTFRYTDDGEEHEVWFEDVSSTAVKLDYVQQYDLGGAFFWRLGGEDPRTWRLLDRR